jgi:hypothetical protein
VSAFTLPRAIPLRLLGIVFLAIGVLLSLFNSLFIYATREWMPGLFIVAACALIAYLGLQVLRLRRWAVLGLLGVIVLGTLADLVRRFTPELALGPLAIAAVLGLTARHYRFHLR